MGAFIAGVTIGLFIGSTVGFITAGLMNASSRTVRAREREELGK